MASSWLVVGHRGAGKTSLIKAIRKDSRFQSLLFYSLDEEIEIRTGLSIAKIFSEQGESSFRDLEKKILEQIKHEQPAKNKVVDVGAGFLGETPSGWSVLWVKRAIDLSQCQFIDRPSLDGSLRISLERFQEREKRYQAKSHWQMELSEGFKASEPELVLLQNLFLEQGTLSLPNPWTLTVLNDSMARSLQHSSLKFQVELRDDLLSPPCFEELASSFPGVLISLRDPERRTRGLTFCQDRLWDWPAEWGDNSEAPILSRHKLDGDISKTLLSYSEKDQIVKLAIPVSNFRELSLGHRWWSENPTQRVFLPSSPDGRWQWYRCLFGAQMPLAFFRLGEGSSPDQPTLLELLRFDSEKANFAAILGDPVNHSLTPAFHHEFFSKKGLNILRVPLKEDEFTEALPLLRGLGLRAAAITSPLKKVAATGTSRPAVNTLAIRHQEIITASTDEAGLKELLADLDLQKPTAVWGGEGVLPAIQQVLPNTRCYSARTGSLKTGEGSEPPRQLLWAVGAKNFTQGGIFPPPNWPLERVIDLHYTLDSPGIDCAHRFGCQYQSGLGMFEAQARKQQEFWNECGI